MFGKKQWTSLSHAALSGAVAFTSLLCTSQVYAYTRCETRSNGYSFADAADDLYTARQRVINDCTSKGYTTNSDCRGNAVCDGDRPAPYGEWKVCRTKSNGYSFVDAASDLRQARANVINDCTSKGYTTNGDCRGNAVCDDDRYVSYPNWFTCHTSSNGYSFVDGADSESQAMNNVINDCTSKGYTDNGYCRANVFCDQAGYPEPAPRPIPVPMPPRPRPIPLPRPVPRPTQRWICSISIGGSTYSSSHTSRVNAEANARSACRRSRTPVGSGCNITAACRLR